MRIQAHTFERLCTGQIRETVGPRPGQDPVEHHLEVVADKTGSLIAASGRYGALMSGASPQHVDTLTEFGERIGVAFQLADDLVDITSESMQSGKTPGTDLREGIPTLAGLIALTSDRTRPTTACSRCRTTPSTPRRWPCCGRTRPSTPRSRTPGRTPPATCCSLPARRRATSSPCCATTSSPAPAERRRETITTGLPK